MTEPDLVLRYAPHPDGIIDVHLPSQTPAPLLVLLHGGFWRAEWDRTHTRPLADAFRHEGYVVVTPEYRRTGAGGGWPHTFDDVRAAMGAIPHALAEQHVPVQDTTVIGHSAGGQLALWLACEGVPMKRVVALAPVGDVEDAFAKELDDDAVLQLLGHPRSHGDRYASADVSRRITSAIAAEVVVLHGTEDAQVPISNTLTWARGNPDVDLRVLPGVDHFELIDPTSAAWPDVRRAVVE